MVGPKLQQIGFDRKVNTWCVDKRQLKHVGLAMGLNEIKGPQLKAKENYKGKLFRLVDLGCFKN
jgi:hypothetical protein